MLMTYAVQSNKHQDLFCIQSFFPNKWNNYSALTAAATLSV